VLLRRRKMVFLNLEIFLLSEHADDRMPLGENP
jgi:hypothetical protein